MYKVLVLSLIALSMTGCSGTKSNVADVTTATECPKECAMQCRTGTLVTSPITLEATHVPDYTPIGACIHINGYCELDSQAHCQLVGGVYQGDGAQCPVVK